VGRGHRARRTAALRIGPHDVRSTGRTGARPPATRNFFRSSRFALRLELLALRTLVRGVGDIGSAVAHRLFVSGHVVVVHDGEQPTITRRGMAFVDAIFDGRTTLDEVEAIRVDDLDALSTTVVRNTVVPIVVLDFSVVLGL